MPKEIVMRHASPHFLHVFSGDGYSAGYYSYMWSEVLDADGFDAFKEKKDAFDPATAKRLYDFIYSAGGTRDFAEAYRLFRGRDPSIEPLLEGRGAGGMIARYAFAVAAVAIVAPAEAAHAPRVSIASFAELSPPEAPYDATANADVAVNAAFDRARKSGKRVLIDLGGNWCGDCRILAGVMDLPEVHAFLARHYEMVSVDVGRFDRNLQIPARFGFTKRLIGVPTVLIATPTGKLVNSNDVFALADARHMAPQAVVDWLAKWAR